ncbi:MAG: hypothetical protein LIO91_07760, partial [Bacteroidales bacterium]|nr:hypothetical protein [Bacteroidales bacterium]
IGGYSERRILHFVLESPRFLGFWTKKNRKNDGILARRLAQTGADWQWHNFVAAFIRPFKAGPP